MCKKEKMTEMPVLAITNRKLCDRPFLEQIERICEWGPEAIILREKDLSPKVYAGLAREVINICKKHSKLCILHSFWKAAQKLDCKDIHLPLPVLRELVMSGQKEKFQRIGTSVHSVEEAREAEKLGATYLTAGHIYATDCKKGVPPRGLEFLSEVCHAVDIPVYAIGGIHVDGSQWKEIGKCGAAGGCVMSEIMHLV